MLSESNLEKLKELASEVSAQEGVFLYDLEFVGRGANRTLRVYIDHEGSEGVSVDQCANVSRGLSLLLDVEDPVPGGAYDLEVSSPGLERVLRQKWHFSRVLGEVIKVKTHQPLQLPSGATAKGPIKQVEGVVKQVDDRQIVIVDHRSREWIVPLEHIHKAHVVFQSDVRNKKKGPGTRRVK